MSCRRNLLLALTSSLPLVRSHPDPRLAECNRTRGYVIDTGSGHDLVDFALVLDSAQLIEPASSNIVLHTANGECRPIGSIIMDIKPLNETSSVLVLENTPNVLSVGLRCMEYGYSFHWPSGQVPYLVTPTGFRSTVRWITMCLPYQRLMGVSMDSLFLLLTLD